MEALKVEKLKLQAQVAIRGRKILRGSFFVVPSGYPIPHSRLLLQLLNESHGFVPLQRASKILLVNKDQIVYVKLEREKTEVEAGLLQRKVQVTLTIQQELLGTVTIDLPEERRRVLDFLNLKSPFFLLEDKKDVYLVNKNMIQDVMPVESK
ncbi:MAG TPA: hypothetical protein VJ521_13555 [Acidobacteriota bacterium]|nr:hypothetical protein [Acidobacteriota bacterium]